MRKNFYRELINYKGQEKRSTLMNDKSPSLDKVHVEYFNVIEGLDPEQVEMINKKLADIKT